MREFTTVDGFAEVIESMGEMIKYVANEPSMGLFYVQQHAHNAIPNLVNLKRSVVKKSHETSLHTEDIEDSIAMVRTMKQFGVNIADEMVNDVKNCLHLMANKKPRRQLSHNKSSGNQKGTSSWRSAPWSFGDSFSQSSVQGSSNYLASMLRSAKEKARNVKGQESGAAAVGIIKSASATIPENELDELPLSSQATSISSVMEKQKSDLASVEERTVSGFGSYEEFKADKEATLVEWLESPLKLES